MQYPKSGPYVVSIEAGGTKCSVTIANAYGVVSSATGGSCNFTTLGLSATLARIRSTVENALLAVADEVNRGAPINIDTARGMRLFAGLTAGVAGVDREADVQRLGFALAELFGLDHTDPQRVIVGNDAMLLSFPLLESDCDSAIAVIAGTGSIAFLFDKDSSGKIKVVRRMGGYGPLLGDEGSGTHVGKVAITDTLAAYDAGKPMSSLHQTIYAHFGCANEPQSLLQRVLQQEPALGSGGPHPLDKIASACQPVCMLAERENAAGGMSQDVFEVLRTAARALADMVIELREARADKRTMLITGGSVLNNTIYAVALEASLLYDHDVEFDATIDVKNAGRVAAEVLSEQLLN